MSPSEPEYGVVVSRDLMVPMRDGIRLASDLYRPARDGDPLSGPFPAILCRTPYDKTDRRYEEIGEHFAPRGYAVVLQDLRDRYRSEGRGEYFHVANEHDGTDGYDTVEWVAAQPWCDGRVVTVGSSFAGLVQTRLALYRPPHLAAMWPDVMPTNSYHHQAREGGAMKLHMFWALFLHAQDAPEIARDPAAQQVVWEGLRSFRTWLRSMPWQPGRTPLAVVPNLEKTLFDYYYRGAYDEFWQRECNDFERHYDRHADVPTTLSGGWFDPFSSGMTRYFSAMAARNVTPQHLVMGPWTHMGMRSGTRYAGEVDFGPESAWGIARYFEEQERFFERALGDAPDPTDDRPSVRLFVMGGGDGRRTSEGKLNHGGTWRREREWPLARTRHVPHYLHADGALTTELPAGAEPPLTFTYDPADPVPTIGGSFAGLMELPPDDPAFDPLWARYVSPMSRMRHLVTIGPAHQREGPDVFGARLPYGLLAVRPDVLVFQTPPLPQALEVTGPLEVTLWISSSAVDTDFTAKLIDVHPRSEDYPDGYHMNLVDSIIRTRFRDTWEREELMRPGQVYRVRIQLPPTSNLFLAGHRIRLDVSSSNFPCFDVNPNTGEPLGRHTRAVAARNAVHVDRDHPSHVVLPVIPADAGAWRLCRP